MYLLSITSLTVVKIIPAKGSSGKKQQRNVYGTMTRCYVGQDSDSLRAGHFGNPMPVGPDFPYQSKLVLGSTQSPAKGRWISFRGVKRPGHIVYHPSLWTFVAFLG